MQSDQGEFKSLLRQAGEGSDVAVQELVEKYGGVIRIAVRRHLSGKLRRQFDSDDFMQTVWKSFFSQRTNSDRFDTPDKLGAFLARVARNKVVEKHRRLQTTQSFNLDREQTATDLNPEHPHDGIGPSATPSQIASAKEQVNRLLADKPDYLRRAIELKAKGLSNEEIGNQLGFNRDSIRRMLRRVKQQIDPGSQEES